MRRAAALHTRARIEGGDEPRVLKILELGEALEGLYPIANVLLHEHDAGEGFAGSFSSTSRPYFGALRVSAPTDATVVRPGDVVRVQPKSGVVSVLYRRGASANSLFVTEQCNSLCLMCSQPPKNEDDSWRLAELIDTVRLVDRTEPMLGITGGEPTLNSNLLGELLRVCREKLPNTRLHLLTNGRKLANEVIAQTLVRIGGDHVTWAIPLYADVAAVHDMVVGSPGAFEETINGFYQMARVGARVEVRVVLHAMTVTRLPQLATYIYRRMPFVEHVALMGLEPTGYAKVNRERLWIDPMDYDRTLENAVHYLSVRGMNVSIYNLPYCVLPVSVWRFARQSISDWKNVYDETCERCCVNEKCAGFFLSAGPSWRSRGFKAIESIKGQYAVA